MTERRSQLCTVPMQSKSLALLVDLYTKIFSCIQTNRSFSVTDQKCPDGKRLNQISAENVSTHESLCSGTCEQISCILLVLDICHN